MNSMLPPEAQGFTLTVTASWNGTVWRVHAERTYGEGDDSQCEKGYVLPEDVIHIDRVCTGVLTGVRKRVGNSALRLLDVLGAQGRLAIESPALARDQRTHNETSDGRGAGDR